MRSVPARLATLVCATVLTTMTAAPAAVAVKPEPPAATVTSLGVPLRDVLVLGGTHAPGPNHEDAIWVVTGGSPARLQSVLPGTGAVLSDQPLVHADGGEGAEGGYAVAATSNGDVYIGTYADGHLYRRAAGPSSPVEDLGTPLPGDSYIFRLTVMDDKLYGGTYPGGAVFRYDPATGDVRDYGRMLPGENYVRSVTSGNGVVYAGTYNCHIFAIDPATGATHELPQPAPDCGNIDDMNLIGGRLFARAGSIINGEEYAYDISSGAWVGSLPHVAGLDLSDVGPDGKVYFMQTDGTTGTLARFDPETLAVEITDAQVLGRVVNNRGEGWVDLHDPAWPGLTYAQVLWRGQVLLYNPQTGRSTQVDANLNGEPITINALAADSRDVYVGGYLSGLAAIDPSSGDTEFHRFAQVESLLPDGGDIWVGAYPDARAYRWDRTLPWNNAAYSPGPVGSPENPSLLDDGSGRDQNRLPSVADLGDAVAFGTQPADSLTGTVVVVDKETHVATVHDGPITDQSTVGLAADDGVLFGGTSIYASYTQPTPTTTDAHLYAMDPDTGGLLWSVVPHPGTTAIRGVEVDTKGRVWALTDGTLTSHNRRNGDLMRTVRLRADTPSGTGVGELAYDAEHNTLWALVQGSALYAVDARTGKARVVLERPMARLAVGPSEAVYVSSGAELLSVDREGCQLPTRDRLCPPPVDHRGGARR